MSQRRVRATYFICVGLIESQNKLLVQEIRAVSAIQARNSFHQHYGFFPQETLGGYFKRKQKKAVSQSSIRFDPQQPKAKRAIYRDWEVDAFGLIEPSNHAYILFQKRLDGKKAVIPTGTITVPLSELRFPDEDKQEAQ